MILALTTATVVPLPATDQSPADPARLDAALAAWLRDDGVTADSARVVGRAPITPALDAVLVRVGTGYAQQHLLIVAPTDGPGEPWGIARIPGAWDEVSLDAAAPTDVIVRVTGGYGEQIYRQYFIDRQRRTVIETREFRNPVPRALEFTVDTLYAAYDYGMLEGFRDRMHFLLRVALDSGAASVTRFFGDEPVLAFEVRNDTLYTLTESSEFWMRGGAWAGRHRARPLQPPAGVRLLHSRLPQFRIVSAGILEMRLADSLFIPLDLPDFEDFVRARPEHHEGVGEVEIATEIGPTTVHRDRVWFGLTFYDGEGMDGVGGIGWFDPVTREARMLYPEEMADWSVSAITGHGESIYVGLVVYPEGAAYGGGIGLYDLATEAFHTLDVDGVVAGIAVRGDSIYTLSDQGLAVVIPGEGSKRFRIVPGQRGTARVDISQADP